MDFEKANHVKPPDEIVKLVKVGIIRNPHEEPLDISLNSRVAAKLEKLEIKWLIGWHGVNMLYSAICDAWQNGGFGAFFLSRPKLQVKSVTDFMSVAELELMDERSERKNFVRIAVDPTKKLLGSLQNCLDNKTGQCFAVKVKVAQSLQPIQIADEPMASPKKTQKRNKKPKKKSKRRAATKKKMKNAPKKKMKKAKS